MEIQRESIFVSALRSFCRSLFIVFGIFIGLFVVSFLFLAFTSSYKPEEKTTMEILPDLSWKKEFISLSAPVVLQINIHGVIGDPTHVNAPTVEDILLDSRTGLFEHDRVKAILLHFDTPGGTVFDADDIYRMLTYYKQTYHVPIYGYVEGLCASGGMYIASAADKMYASASSIIGSVGVISGPFFNFSEAIARFGVQAQTLTNGLDKDAMNPFRTWKPNEAQNLEEIQAILYDRFVEIVTTNRPRLDKTKLVEVYGAKIYNSVPAQEYGYIDVANSDYRTALSDLLAAAQIDASKPYQVVQLKPKRGLLSDLVQGRSPLLTGKLEHRIGSEFEIKDPVAYLYRP